MIAVVVLCALMGSLAVGCSGNDDGPGITRIDGPAVVDQDGDGDREG